MTLPAGKPDADPTPSDLVTGPRTARSERGWWKLFAALAAFYVVPLVFGSIVPVDQTIVLFAPALAACALVGWWAGGRPWQALLWVALATWVTWQPQSHAASFDTLVRGWCLLLAGSFGLVSLLSVRQPFFTRALTAVGIALGLALVMSMLGPVSFADASHVVSEEFSRRNAAWMATINDAIAQRPEQWKQLHLELPQLVVTPEELQRSLVAASKAGVSVFPALLALQSLAALALAWAAYHRLSRSRLGRPLSPLRDFRFNDQLVWGLIVGLVIMFLPTLSTLSGVGRNLLVFFGALYAIRGLGVLSWFLSPGRLATALAIAFAMLFWPVLNLVAAFGLMLLGVAAFGLGLGDTWADWRGRARPTT